MRYFRVLDARTIGNPMMRIAAPAQRRRSCIDFFLVYAAPYLRQKVADFSIALPKWLAKQP